MEPGRDARLRRLAREAPDDPQVAARLLAERVRAGQASQADLRLLALLGHAAASEVLGQPPPSAQVRDLQARLLLLWDFGLAIGLRANVAAARFFLEAWELEQEDDRRPHEALAAVDEWLDVPEDGRDEARQACVLSADPARRAAAVAGTVGGRLACGIAAESCAVIWQPGPGPQARIRATAWCAVLAEAGLALEPVWGAVQAALVPWALSRGVQPRTYSTLESYAKGETIRHRDLGIGVVEEVAGGKIVVRFEADPLTRKLVHRPAHR